MIVGRHLQYVQLCSNGLLREGLENGTISAARKGFWYLRQTPGGKGGSYMWRKLGSAHVGPHNKLHGSLTRVLSNRQG